ncbi:hypothetical protein FRB97_000194 [Tulasnella sp. 331]|nr:hypothetical protein FRB97_000194 [Tulasnella sp. 331]
MSRVRDVWSTNLDQEMATLRETVEHYPYIAVDTEFPGIVARPIGAFKNHNEFQYQTMRCNVELLRVIQIGLTLCDADGNFAPEPCTWQFNFKFDLDEDMIAPESVDLLRVANLDFQRHRESGIIPDQFAELLITSGLVLNDEVTWVSYASQNDLGYLLKVLTAAPLPTAEVDFHDLLAIWLPRLYDIKYIVRSMRPIKAGLQELADEFGIARQGQAPQAGINSHVIAAVFFKVRNAFFGGEDIDETKFSGHIYGISGDSSFMPTNAPSVSTPGGTMGHQPSLHTQYAAQAMTYGMYR